MGQKFTNDTRFYYKDLDENVNGNLNKDLDENLAWLTQKAEDP